MEIGPVNSPASTPLASGSPSNLREATSLRSRMARGEKIFCSAATIMRFALVHAERGNLHDEHVLVFVHDEAAEEIALGIDHAEGGGVGHVLLPDGERVANAFLEKGFVDLDAFRREDADVDFRFGIEKADAEQALAMVFDLDEFAVAGVRGQAENGAVINPRMAGDDAVGFARF